MSKSMFSSKEDYMKHLITRNNELKQNVKIMQDNNHRVIILIDKIMRTLEVEDPVFSDLSEVIAIIKGFEK